MNAMSDIKFVIFAILALGVIWIVVTGGGDTGGPFLKPPAPLGTGETYGNRPGINITQGIDFGGGGGRSGGSDDSTNTSGVITDISELQKLVTISGSGGARQTDPDKEYIRIRISRNAKGKIGISNWRLQSRSTGAGDTLSKGTYLPYSGRVNTKLGIFLEAGDEVIITTGRSPIGASFRMNICTGYFEQFQDFTPALPRLCPDPLDDLPDFGPGDTFERCYDFVDRLPRCELFLKSVQVNVGGLCQNYITTEINYNTCVKNHKDDPGFYDNEWRVYLERDDELWRSRRETIDLLDSNGQLIDTITY